MKEEAFVMPEIIRASPPAQAVVSVHPSIPLAAYQAGIQHLETHVQHQEWKKQRDSCTQQKHPRKKQHTVDSKWSPRHKEGGMIFVIKNFLFHSNTAYTDRFRMHAMNANTIQTPQATTHNPNAIYMIIIQAVIVRHDVTASTFQP
jgi:hypothetical protein